MISNPAAKARLCGLLLLAAVSGVATAETCKTQAQMDAAQRDGLSQAAMTFARRVQASDGAGIRAETIAEYQQDFNGINNAIVSTSSKIKAATLQVDMMYVLDAATLKADAGGAAQFFCTLSQSALETDFQIPGLPQGVYGFVIVNAPGAAPWQLSFLMRQEQGQWKLAGFYPRALTAAGHDGLWYWTSARTMREKNHPWSAWLYFQEAVNLLRPVGFLNSTHLEKLLTEQSAAAPPALSAGISNDVPLVVKSRAGVEYRFTGLAPDDSLEKDKVELVAHLKVQQNGDAAEDRKRNIEAMTALLAAYPELRLSFHGVWIFAEAPGQTATVPTEMAMDEIPS